MRKLSVPLLLLCPLLLASVQTLSAQAPFLFYTDTLVNGASDQSFNCTHNTSDTNLVHTGSYSFSIAITSSGGGLSVRSSTFNSSPYTNVSFWINGGPTGGQNLKVYGLRNGNPQTAYVLPRLGTNVWQQFTVPFSSLGVGNVTDFNGVRIVDNSGGAQPVFYVDDLQIGGGTPPLVTLNVNATSTLRKADSRWFGVNLATWDGNLGNAATIPLLQQAGILQTRLPGGSGADTYHWAQNAAQNATFYKVATNLGVNGQAFITVNYGSGTSGEAAGWVNDANMINHCNFKYWEIGNECYGGWEQDTNANAHDPYTYAVHAAAYIAAMKAVDPTIKIGVVASPGEDSYNGSSTYTVTNSRTGQTHKGWVPVVLTILKSYGQQPDFLIHHVYPEYSNPSLPSPPNPSSDSDPLLLQVSNWSGDAASLRQMITDYWGTGGTNIEICCTENNSDSSNGGKQLSSLVNALYIADTLSKLMQTEINSYMWWDLRNGFGSNGDIDPSLYGWRIGGDEGLISGASSLYPTYYSMKLMQYFVRPGDTVLNAPSSSYVLLSPYAARRSDGALSLLVINKDSLTNFVGQINLSNFWPRTNAIIHSYGIPQDNATRDGLSAQLQDIATTNYSSASNSFTYSFPPYSMTVFTLFPTNYITLSLQMPLNVDWNTITNWSDGQSASVSAANNPASVYDVLAGAILRSPTAGPATFPGSQLIVDGDENWTAGADASVGEFRLKTSTVSVPWLKMNGGQIDVSVGTNTQSVINGRIDILGNTPIYNDPANDEGLTINAFLTGTDNIEWHDQGFSLANGKTLNIACNTNTYTGTWNVVQGTLVGSGANALGPGTITVGPGGYLETTYNIYNTNGALALNGKMLLHQNDTFKSVTIGGVALSSGVHYFAELSSNYPSYFPSSWTLQTGSTVANGSGSLTVYQTAPVIIQQPQPASRTLLSGLTAQFGVLASGDLLQYQWLAGAVGSGVFTNLVNGGGISGATNATLTISNLATYNTADYIVEVYNSSLAVTSSIATLKVVRPTADPYQQAVLAQGPIAFYALTETNDPILGTAIAFDYIGGNNGTYGTNVQNGNAKYNIAGPRPPAYPGFSTNSAAAAFPGNTGTSRITCPAMNINTNTVTLTAWIKPSTTAQSNWASIFENRSGSAGNYGYAASFALQYNGSGNRNLTFNWNENAATYGWNTSGLVPPSGQWSFVALVVSPTNGTIYLFTTNGLSMAAITDTNTVFQWTGNTVIAEDPKDAVGFNGAISGVAFFNYCLTQAQLQNLFNAAPGSYSYPPVIVTSPASESLYSGMTARLTVSADGSSPFTYQWLAGITNSGVYTNVINAGGASGATNATLVISNIASANQGDYLVVVTNSAGAVTSAVARVTVMPTGAFGSAVLARQPAAFYQMDETTSTPGYNGTAYDGCSGYNGTYGAGVFKDNKKYGPELFYGSWPNHTAFEYPNYAAGFSSAANSQVTLPAFNLNTNTVTLMAMIKPNNAGGFAGSSLIFSRAGTTVAGLAFTGGTNGGLPTLGYNWGNDAATTNWNSGLVPSYVSGAQQWSLVALVITPTNSTIYLATARYGTTTNYIASATQAHSNAVMAFDGTTLVGRDSGDVTGAHFFDGDMDDVAVFSHALSQGDFLYLATNGLGIAAAAPTITTQPAGQTNGLGQTATFTVVAAGTPAFSYQWQAGAVSSGIYTNLADGGNRSGSTGPTLTISNVSIADAADFRVVITNFFGSTNSVARLTVVPPPVASFTLAPASGAAPLTVWFTNATAQGTFVSGLWDFGDGVSGDTNIVVSHVYANPGNYTVSLTVTNSIGAFNTASVSNAVAVTPPPLSPLFALSTMSAATNMIVYFTNQTTGTYDSVVWSFGDSQTSSDLGLPGSPVGHYYASEGSYDVTLAATNTATGQGAISAKQSVTVTNLAPASVAGNPGITSVAVAGGYVTIVGTNAPNSGGHQYNVIWQTNVAAAPDNWQAITNGQFAPDGRFTNSVPVSGGVQFLRIQVPAP